MKDEANSTRGVTQIVKPRAYVQIIWLLPCFYIIFAVIPLFATIHDWTMLFVAPLAVWILTAIVILAGWSTLKINTEKIEYRSLGTFILKKTLLMKEVRSFQIEEVEGTDVTPDRSRLVIFSANESKLGGFWLFPENTKSISDLLLSLGKKKL